GFFFQAEDGIRDATVTGVQTCALPISWMRHGPKMGGCLGHQRQSRSRSRVEEDTSGSPAKHSQLPAHLTPEERTLTEFRDFCVQGGVGRIRRGQINTSPGLLKDGKIRIGLKRST